MMCVPPLLAFGGNIFQKTPCVSNNFSSTASLLRRGLLHHPFTFILFPSLENPETWPLTSQTVNSTFPRTGRTRSDPVKSGAKKFRCYLTFHLGFLLSHTDGILIP